MLLDQLALESLTLMVQYPTAYEVWDRAGLIARGMSDLWPDLELVEGTPLQQILKSSYVQIQTGIKQSSLAVLGPKSLDVNSLDRIKNTYDVWRGHLSWKQPTRVSTRAIFVRYFDTMADANLRLRELGLVKWPVGKVFDQSENSDLNSYEAFYRFEDAKSFTLVRLRTEQLKYERKGEVLFEDEGMSRLINRLVLDFDRGVTSAQELEKLRIGDFLKGFNHVLRRDIGKLTGEVR